ncbi:hypothetical protein [Roseateles asaccharophilus]|uniref:Uncharacterized protein n=1 Tax=Roseateles asaccharophilus TaxID=582607 RepID=A0ABU2A3L0_9BURK|nr:hypothetical protein [Roseateles asaccharophilus]MDR7331778.1 hypothetical protein [Roseateles asaccharophilus]
MGLIKEILAAMFGGRLEPAADAAEAAWRDYESTWAMDPPPDPREVFIAGYRARDERQPEPR